MEEKIDATLAEIAKTRVEMAQRGARQRASNASPDKLLAGLAKLKAERLRLLQRQRMAVR